MLESVPLAIGGVDGVTAIAGLESVQQSNTLLFSRIQFALNISFHILFPTISIALGWFLFYFKVRFQFSSSPVWMRVYRFWVKVFALTFALGVVSGITMSFQFGTNWPGFMEKVGNIAGPLLGYEVLSAFFLEATFLGVMLFGIKRVPGWVHTLATFVVAVGTTLSAFWIIALNSWMHTPAGFELREGVAFPLDWFAIIFNPSMPYRLTHVLLSSVLTAAFLIVGISAYRLLKGDKKHAPEVALKTGLLVAACAIPLQVFVGDLHGLNTLKHQPQKIAAMEAAWKTEKGLPLVVLAWPDEKLKANRFAIEIPRLASVILTHDANGEVKGLDAFEGNTPPVKPLFFGFRIMIGVGVCMWITSWLGVYFFYRKKFILSKQRLVFKKIFVGMTFSGWIATLSGWYVTEIGRQPYLVSGILKTHEAVTTLPSGNVLFSLVVYALIYSGLLVAYIHTLFVMARRSIEVDEYEISDGVFESNRQRGYTV